MKKQCIVHYSGHSGYGNLKPISSNVEDRLREAKQRRFDIGGENYHHNQCEYIPDVINHQIHYVHLLKY